ncbi:MAG: SUMF1/EgtB/PvdO family nonheme iron enzyme [Candidatus Brocadiae bacterium]|nr:SUMF1/EgtB/PvdO family nonheme iron enzyme [Candidatus Brocadiia bacterium]
MAIGAMVLLSAVGFLDDYTKLRRKHNQGLSAKAKIAGQILVGLLMGAYLLYNPIAVSATYLASHDIPDWPAFAVGWEDAAACARWRSLREGRLYALPHETDWEHAARGPDARPFPWGHAVEAHVSNTNTSQAAGMRPARVGEFPLDESPYGVRGMGGNIQQWCLNEGARGGRRWTMIRGVSWPQSFAQSRASIRTAATRNYLNFTVGFRLVAPVRLG